MSDFCDPIDYTLQASLSMGFPWQEYWSGLLFPCPGYRSDPGIESMSLVFQADSTHIYVNPFQYSCLKIPWTKEPGGLQSMGLDMAEATEYDMAHV